jgi:hypothetical protein
MHHPFPPLAPPEPVTTRSHSALLNSLPWGEVLIFGFSFLLLLQ